MRVYPANSICGIVVSISSGLVQLTMRAKAKHIKQAEALASEALACARSFNDMALEVYKLQRQFNPVYSQWCNTLRAPEAESIGQIPFLPISFFKQYRVVLEGVDGEAVFRSSGTTAHVRSEHVVGNLKLYDNILLKSWKRFLGRDSHLIYAMLPGYVGRQDASLLYMVKKLMEENGQAPEAYFEADPEEMYRYLLAADPQPMPILFTVTHALADIAEQAVDQLSHVSIIETGGMKGRRIEPIREELYSYIRLKLAPLTIGSEYGMTELLSPSYAGEDGLYSPPSTLRAFIRRPDDPLTLKDSGRGVLNLIDLTNTLSCSFIATDDLGEVYENGSFSVLGRLDHAEARGCSLLYS